MISYYSFGGYVYSPTFNFSNSLYFPYKYGVNFQYERIKLPCRGLGYFDTRFSFDIMQDNNAKMHYSITYNRNILTTFGNSIFFHEQYEAGKIYYKTYPIVGVRVTFDNTYTVYSPEIGYRFNFDNKGLDIKYGYDLYKGSTQNYVCVSAYFNILNLEQYNRLKQINKNENPINN